MNEELEQIEKNNTWELVPRPKDKNVIGTKWIFKNKLNENCRNYRVSSSDRTPKDIVHKHITDQYTSIFDVVKTLKEGSSPRPEPTRPLQAIY